MRLFYYTYISHYENIPQGWYSATIQDLCSVIGGLWTGKKPPFVNVGVIRNTNFGKNFTLDLTNVAYLDVESKQFAKRQLQYGDLILEKSGGSDKQPVGRVILYDKTEGLFSFSNFTAVLRIKDQTIIQSTFLFWVLCHYYLNGITRLMQKQTTGIHNLIMEKYITTAIPLPPLAEQQRIVTEIERVFAVLDTIEENLR